jgi:hypothetical protein
MCPQGSRARDEVLAVEGAKTEQTRQRRLAKIIDQLQAP